MAEVVSPNGHPTPIPVVQPEVKVFWDATAEGKLLLPKCTECQTLIWFPRPFCPSCGSLSVEWIEASGKGTIYTYTVNRRGAGDLIEYREPVPYVLAYVELEEGPRIMTNIVDCDVDSVKIGQAVEAIFHDTGEGTALVRFRPAS
ncbi:MAG: Zn-ribbon domain-containing OB-fold protein [Chloroflexota bacterium]